jgi:hypothetical protein
VIRTFSEYIGGSDNKVYDIKKRMWNIPKNPNKAEENWKSLLQDVDLYLDKKYNQHLKDFKRKTESSKVSDKELEDLKRLVFKSRKLEAIHDKLNTSWNKNEIQKANVIREFIKLYDDTEFNLEMHKAIMKYPNDIKSLETMIESVELK